MYFALCCDDIVIKVFRQRRITRLFERDGWKKWKRISRLTIDRSFVVFMLFFSLYLLSFSSFSKNRKEYLNAKQKPTDAKCVWENENVACLIAIHHFQYVASSFIWNDAAKNNPIFMCLFIRAISALFHQFFRFCFIMTVLLIGQLWYLYQWLIFFYCRFLVILPLV